MDNTWDNNHYPAIIASGAMLVGQPVAKIKTLQDGLDLDWSITEIVRVVWGSDALGPYANDLYRMVSEAYEHNAQLWVYFKPGFLRWRMVSEEAMEQDLSICEDLQKEETWAK